MLALNILNAITWGVSPEIVNIGPLTLRWYGLLFALGFILGLYIVKRMFEQEKVPEKWLDYAFITVFLGALIGARLGHVFFYDWADYRKAPLEIIKVWKGGLASHGGAIGIIIALWFFSKFVSKKSILWILDKVVVPTALAGCFIRLGNLMNSEIVGNPSDVPWAFIFTRLAEDPRVLNPLTPRHPVQLYEAFSYLISFFVLYYIYWKTNKRHQQGFIFGLFLILIFGFRIIWEYFKESQGGIEENFNYIMSTGQLLSVPFVIIGLYFVLRKSKST